MQQRLDEGIHGGGLELQKSQVVFRCGSPISPFDLKNVSAGSARTSIVLAKKGLSADESDALSVRTVLCLSNLYDKKPTDVKSHIVVEVCDVDNAILVELVGKNHVETVVSHDIIGRLMIQCARQRGLAEVLDNILGFEGSEFYIKNWPELEGVSFGDVQGLFDTAIVVGVKVLDREPPRRLSDVQRRNSHDESNKSHNLRRLIGESDLLPRPNSCNSLGSRTSRPPLMPQCSTQILIESHSRWNIAINPPREYKMQKNDELIVIAVDDNTYWPRTVSGEKASKLSGEKASKLKFLDDEFKVDISPESKSLDLVCSRSGHKKDNDDFSRLPEKICFLGWRRDLGDMITELDSYVETGSTLTIIAADKIKDRQASLEEDGRDMSKLKNIVIVHKEGSPVSRRSLEECKIDEFESLLILSEKKYEDDIQKSDSRSLASLILVRDLQAKAGEENQCHTIISEILDAQTKEQAQTADICDYVASNELISKVLAMVSERRETNAVLSELLSAAGSENFLIRPFDHYFEVEGTFSFWQISHHISKYSREIAIGYKKEGEQLVINPTNKQEKMLWSFVDKLVVIGENVVNSRSKGDSERMN